MMMMLLKLSLSNQICTIISSPTLARFYWLDMNSLCLMQEQKSGHNF